MAVRTASFFSGTACESCSSRATPAGNDWERNSILFRSQRSWHLRTNVMRPLFQRPSSLVSNTIAWTGPEPMARCSSTGLMPGRPA